MPKENYVLALDDEESILNSLKRIFINTPYSIATFSDPHEALSFLKKGSVKVVLSDYRMPKMLGTEFLKKVKADFPDVIRILFTGYADFSAAEEAINVGEVYRFISKPWNTDELRATVNNAIEHFDLVIENRSLLEETRQKNEELEEANEKLKAAYEVQKEFTSTVSHELRTPLASIKTAIDLVVKGMVGEISPDQEEVLGRAKRNVDRLKCLVDDILDLTKMESGKLEMSMVLNDINMIVKDVAESQKDVARERGLYLKTDLDESLPNVPFDSKRVVQVLNNLLNNAIKFTKEGGVTVVTENKPQDNHIVIRIKDTGKGISGQDLSKLFQKFQQLESAQDNEDGGTGLGLAICKEIVGRHGGKIWAESTLGEGTAFSFLLPIQERRGDAS